MKRMAIKIKTDGAGAATRLSPRPVVGEVAEIRLVDAGLNEAGKADWTFTRNEDGGAVLTLANVDGPWSRSPRQAVHDVNGAAALFAAGGTAIVDRVPMAGHLKIQVAQAKPNAEGEIVVYYDEDED